MDKVKNSRIKLEFVVLSVILIYRILAFLCFDLRYTLDSYEYLSRDGFAIFHGSPDRYRLPVYPLLMDLFLKISEDNGLIFLGIFQFLVSLLSVFILYLTLRKIVDNKIICLAFTFFYSVYDAVVIWDDILLTESLSLSLTVFLLYGLVSFVKERKMRCVIFISLILVIGSFLRAVFAIYAGLFTGALILIMIFGRSDDKDDSRVGIKTYVSYVLISLMPIVLILMYAGAFYKSYNAFTLSDSYLGQQLSVVLGNGYYLSSTDDELVSVSDSILNDTYDSEDKRNDITKKIESIFFELYELDTNINSITEARYYIMESYERDRIERFVNDSIENNRISHYSFVVMNLFDDYSFGEYYILKNDSYITMYFYLPVHILISSFPLLEMNLLFAFWVSLAEISIFLLTLLIKKKKLWIRLGLGVYIASTVWLAITGTNDEFARTALTALPFVFVAFALYIASLFALIRKKV